MALPKLACNAELAPKIILLTVLLALVICGVLTLVSSATQQRKGKMMPVEQFLLVRALY